MSTVSTVNQSVSEYTHTIDGQAETSVRLFEVINPATGAAFASAPDASPEQLGVACR
jgi:acyl-CoA reductase-like NAD-dependent aldehyde dehydrogenase